MRRHEYEIGQESSIGCDAQPHYDRKELHLYKKSKHFVCFCSRVRVFETKLDVCMLLSDDKEQNHMVLLKIN
jgi:hypothetical protein